MKVWTCEKIYTIHSLCLSFFYEAKVETLGFTEMRKTAAYGEDEWNCPQGESHGFFKSSGEINVEMESSHLFKLVPVLVSFASL